ncbi:hypothetical protein [Neolewinella persica]|uniref:hypothetical protein n=1 Tax=Neolewinella persica TaxID=70998 RepID=UPI00037BF92D|nr:hypothetical protein [Neolewinella persica]
MTTTEPQLINDIILNADASGNLLAYQAKGFPKYQKVYSIGGEPVEKVIRFPNHDFILLSTATGNYLRDLDNQPVAEEEHWTDFYFEPLTEGLYRKDERNNWYDLEGFRLMVPVFLKGDVLVSLPGKISRKSWAFAGQEVLISPQARLIQVGKMVFDTNLEAIRYFGERITGLGRGHISFGGEDQWQEVCRGRTERAFVNEFTGAPLLINDEEIIAHLGGEIRGIRHFEVLRSAQRTYTVENAADAVISYLNRPLEVDMSTYLELNGREIVRVTDGRKDFYFDLQTRAPFRLAAAGEELIHTISHKPVRVPGVVLYDVGTAHKFFVYDTRNNRPFKLEGEDILPTSIEEVSGFEAWFFLALIDGASKLCTKHDLKVVRLGSENLEIANILSKSPTKLVNARGTRGERLVLDLRRGAEQLTLAMADGHRIEAATGAPHRIGDRFLQHVSLASLGGAVPRLVDLELETLATFTLPEDLTEYPDQPQSSCFASNPITGINFSETFLVQGEAFLRATFLTYQGEEEDLVLKAGNAGPLHLDGAGHRNELVVGFKEHTIHKPYHLGEHLLVGARTLNEELKSGELLFSISRYQSWLPFYDTFLPVFRRAIELSGKEYWPCYLFEALEHGGSGEYIAVEKEEPYRVLATRKKDKVLPKIVTTKSRALLDPNDVSGLIDLFVDRGMLVEVA